MAANEEVEEHVHHAANPFDKTVAATMAIIAALLAVVSVLGQHFNTEELLKQQQASDQWAFSQAKDIRRYTAQISQDAFAYMKADPGLIGKYAQDSNKYKKQHDDIQNEARGFEKERDQSGRMAVRFHFGEVFLEVAIVLSSLAILTKARPLFFGGVALALVGIIVSATAWSV